MITIANPLQSLSSWSPSQWLKSPLAIPLPSQPSRFPSLHSKKQTISSLTFDTLILW